MISKYLMLVLKGLAMGSANVIPGVSGGTIAFITGIYEELINAIKSFDVKAIKLLGAGKLSSFARHINLWFLISLLMGIVISILSLARLLEYLFDAYPILLWAFFFGLILASVLFVGKTVKKWTFSSLFFF